MLKITKKVEYSLIVLQYFNKLNAQDPVSARQICDLYKLPFDPVAKVMQTLKSKQVLASDMGSKGGYYLNIDLSVFNYFELVKMIEKIPDGDLCTSKQCSLTETCNITRPIGLLQNQTNNFLKQITIQQLLNG